MGPPIERWCQVSVEMGPPIERRCQVSNPLIKRNPPKFINFRPAEVWPSSFMFRWATFVPWNWSVSANLFSRMLTNVWCPDFLPSFHRFGALGCCQGLSRLKDALTSTGLATICEQFLEARKADSEEVQKLSDSDGFWWLPRQLHDGFELNTMSLWLWWKQYKIVIKCGTCI